MAKSRLIVRLAYRNGRTRMVEHHQSAPLKIARTFEREDGGLDICIMDASPGLLAGDSYEMEWGLEPGAKARVTTQGATRVHPSTGPISTQMVRIDLAEEAQFGWWPESTIPFVAARFTSTIEAQLAGNASLTIFESLSSGRIARGESFNFAEVVSKIHVAGSTGPRLFTRNRFAPDELELRESFSWGDATQFSSLYAFGLETDAEQAQAALNALDVQGGVSTLPRGDLAVMMLGRRAHDLRHAALQVELLLAPVSRETP